MRLPLPPGYHPSDAEEFMNPLQIEYFRQKLLRWRAQLLAESSDTLQHLKEESLLKPDLTDRASLETERAIELRTRARERKLISKIEAALHRIDDGTYGYCEETDEPIGVRRLEARPIATLSIEAQERHESPQQGLAIAAQHVVEPATGRRQERDGKNHLRDAANGRARLSWHRALR